MAEDNPAPQASFKYWAFISYCHRDKTWADWLHRSIETFKVPARLVGRPARDGVVPKRLFPVFRDREELPTSASLSENIGSALRQSRYLVVICSPQAAASRWVNEEIRAFKKLGREDHVLALIVEGEPNASDKPASGLAECFPDALRFKAGPDGELCSEPAEPIAADARPGQDGKDNARLKVLAGLLGVGFDELRQRDLERRRRQQALTAAGAAVIATLFAGAWIWQERAKNRALSLQLSDAFTFRAETALKESNLLEASLFLARAREVARTARVEAADLALPQTLATFGKNLTGHEFWINGLAFSPDSRTLASCSNDKTVKLWDPDGGRLLKTLSGHANDVQSVAFSPDGRWLASGGVDGAVKVWDTGSGKLRQSFAAGDVIYAVAVSSKGVLAGGGAAAGIKLWDPGRGRLLKTLPATEGTRALAFSPDGKWLAVGANDKTVALWDAAAGKRRRVMKGHLDAVLSVAFSPDGRWLASGAEDRAIKLWDAASGKEVLALTGCKGRIESVAFSPNGRVLAASCWDNTARLWDLTDEKSPQLLAHKDNVTAVAFSPDGRRLAAANGGVARIALWDLAPVQKRPISRPLRVRAAAISRDGRLVAAGLEDKSIRVWDAESGKEERVFAGLPRLAESLAFSPDGRVLAGFDGGKTISLRELSSGKTVGELAAPNGAAAALVFSPDGRLLAGAAQDGSIGLWETAGGRALRAPSARRAGASAAVFSPDGRWLIGGGKHGTVEFWDTAAAKAAAPQPSTGTVAALAFSPDGRLIASSGDDGSVTLRKTAGGKPLWTAADPDSISESLAFSPDGRLLAAGRLNGLVRLWDAATGRALQDLAGHRRTVMSLIFSPDGRSLTSIAHSLDSSEMIFQIGDKKIDVNKGFEIGVWNAKVPATTTEAERKTGMALDGFDPVFR